MEYTPCLLGLPTKVRANILRNLLNARVARVEEEPSWVPLHGLEMEKIASNATEPYGYCPARDRRRGQTGLVTHASCTLNPTILQTCQQLYKEGREILVRENKFVAVSGWSAAHQRQLLICNGSVPMWLCRSGQSGKRKLGVALKGLIVEIPSGVEPVMTLGYADFNFDDTVLIDIHDLEAVCKTIRHMCMPPKASRALRLTIPEREDGTMPSDWGCSDFAAAKYVLKQSVVKYLWMWLEEIFLGPHTMSIENRDSGIFGRELNTLEHWIGHLRYSVDDGHGMLNATFNYMHAKSLQHFRRAERRYKSDTPQQSIPLYLQAKELMHRLCIEEPDWYKAQRRETLVELQQKFVLCCARLGTLIHVDEGEQHRVHELDLVPGPAAAQWAYINTKLAIELEAHLKPTILFMLDLRVRLAILKYQLRHSDRSIADTLRDAFTIMVSAAYKESIFGNAIWASIYAKQYLQGDDDPDWDGSVSACELPESETRYVGPQREQDSTRLLEDRADSLSYDQWKGKISLLEDFYAKHVSGFNI